MGTGNWLPRMLVDCTALLRQVNRVLLHLFSELGWQVHIGVHRFPMDKYRETRLLLQSEAQTSALTTFTPSPPAPKEDLLRV